MGRLEGGWRRVSVRHTAERLVSISHLSIFVRSMPRSEKQARALNSTPGPSESEKTMDVFQESPGVTVDAGGSGSRDRAMKRLQERRARKQLWCRQIAPRRTHVKLCWSSWMSASSTDKPYSSPARELATAAQSLRRSG